MIGKIKKGKGFAGLTKYILTKEQAELICTNLAGETPQDFYRQLAATRQLNKRVQSPVSHISISFAPGEKPDKQQLEEIVEGVREGMGFDNSLFFAAAHNDCHHFHLHIATSRITQDGKCVPDWQDKRHLEKVLRELEKQFDLIPVQCSWEAERTALTTGQVRRLRRQQQEYESQGGIPPERPVSDKIQDAIEVAIATYNNFTDFVRGMEEVGVKVGAKVTREGVVDGLRYEMDGVRFQASKLGHTRKPTIPGLQQQGVEFNLKRDARTLAQIAYSNKQKDDRPALVIERLIFSNPANKTLKEKQILTLQHDEQLPHQTQNQETNESVRIESRAHQNLKKGIEID